MTPEIPRIAARPPFLRRWQVYVVGLPLLAVALFVAYVWLALSWSYSEGERAGYVQGFSKQGWVCKTWEGELAMVSLPGTLYEKFPFTVRDERVAEKINKTMGKRVSVVYQQHAGIPSRCFGETSRYVVDVRLVD